MIILDHRVSEQSCPPGACGSLKYRGSLHGTNEYPFLIGDRASSVLPITSLGLDHDASDERVSPACTARRHARREGCTAGSTVLVSGTAGTGKTTLAAQSVDAACAAASGPCTSPSRSRRQQIVRNMRSVGIDLGQWVDAGLLQVWGEPADRVGLEAHLRRIEKLLDEREPPWS